MKPCASVSSATLDRAPGAPAAAAAQEEAVAKAEALTREIAGLRQELAEMQVRSDHLLHLIEQVQARQERTLVLPLPLARLGTLICEPGPSLAFLKEMGTLAIATGTELRRDEAGHWQPKVRWGKAGRNLFRDFSRLVFGQRSVVYRVRQQHPALPDRPRVLHVIPNVFVGGSTQLVVDLMERLGHRFDMRVLTAALPPHGRHEGMEVDIVPLGSPAEAFKTAYERARPDIIHIHYWGESDRPWYVSALAAARETAAAVLQNVNTPVEPLRDPRVMEYLFVSHYIRAAFAPDVTNGRVIHPGIDLDRFSPRPFAPDAQDTIGMVYRLTRDKLSEESLDPMIEVARRRPRTRILVVGNGDLLPVFLRRVTDAGVRRNFEFAGTVPYADLPDIYSRFRTFVAPVVRESFGQVSPFAMAMGQAVAGFKVGALPEILGGTQTLGSDSAELADILLHLLDNPAEIDALGARNREGVRAFGVEAMVESYGTVYAAALRAHEARLPGVAGA